jgi:hypothetical protein
MSEKIDRELLPKQERLGGFVWPLAAATALGFVVVVGVLARGAWSPLFQRHHLRTAPVAGVKPDATVALLRSDAQKACEAGDWAECAAKLDVAKSLDPAGDELQEVAELRKRAAEARRRDDVTGTNPQHPRMDGGPIRP